MAALAHATANKTPLASLSGPAVRALLPSLDGIKATYFTLDGFQDDLSGAALLQMTARELQTAGVPYDTCCRVLLQLYSREHGLDIWRDAAGSLLCVDSRSCERYNWREKHLDNYMPEKIVRLSDIRGSDDWSGPTLASLTLEFLVNHQPDLKDKVEGVALLLDAIREGIRKNVESGSAPTWTLAWTAAVPLCDLPAPSAM